MLLGVIFFGWIVASSLAVSVVASTPTVTASAPSAVKAEQSASIDLPAPVGQDMKGIVIPQYDSQGRMTMRFSAATACKIDEHQLELNSLTIEFFEKDGKDITVAVPHGIFNLETKILSSDAKTSIKREDFDVLGKSSTFDTTKRLGTMKGHVHTEIRNTTPSDDL